jgi:hypothetical protein
MAITRRLIAALVLDQALAAEHQRRREAAG